MSCVACLDDEITIRRGENRTLRITVHTRPREGTETWDDVPLQVLTGYRLLLSMASEPEAEVILTKDTAVAEEGEIPNQGADPGVAYFYLLPVDTVDLTPGPFVIDVWLFTPDNEEECILDPQVINIGKRVRA